MEKVVIIGSPGAGKTTLAKKLGTMQKNKVYHLDRFFWQHDWEKKDRDERLDTLQKLVRERHWIIEGTYLNSSTIHLKAADTIIFLDISPFLCLQRIIKRHREYYRFTRRDIPEGCTDRLTLFRMLKVLIFPLRERRKLENNLRIYESSEYETKRVIRLHSDKEVNAFLEQQNVLHEGTSAKERIPVVAGR